MASTINPLFTPQQLAAAAATLFTAVIPTQIVKLTLVNSSTTTPYTATVYLVPPAGTPGLTNIIVNAKQLQANESWDVWPAIGHIMGIGYALSAFASVANQITAFGSGLMVSS